MGHFQNKQSHPMLRLEAPCAHIYPHMASALHKATKQLVLLVLCLRALSFTSQTHPASVCLLLLTGAMAFVKCRLPAPTPPPRPSLSPCSMPLSAALDVDLL